MLRAFFYVSWLEKRRVEAVAMSPFDSSEKVMEFSEEVREGMRSADIFWWKLGQDWPWSWSCSPALLPPDPHSLRAGLDVGRQAGFKPPWTRFLC